MSKYDPKLVEAMADAHFASLAGDCAEPMSWAEFCEVDPEMAEQVREGERAALDALCAHLRLTPEALLALADDPPRAVVANIGEVTCEAEAERDELFNRLGRVTEELGLPVDATASRIIEAIDERVAAEREACASLDVRVEVPASPYAREAGDE